jgi:hypothetical protein
MLNSEIRLDETEFDALDIDVNIPLFYSGCISDKYMTGRIEYVGYDESDILKIKEHIFRFVEVHNPHKCEIEDCQLCFQLAQSQEDQDFNNPDYW